MNEATAYSAPIARNGDPDTNASDTGAKADESFVGDITAPPRTLKIVWF